MARRRRRRLAVLSAHVFVGSGRSDATPLCSSAQPDAASASTSVLPTGGLFVNDYTRLPSLTNDMARATADIDEFGYCIWRDAISHPERRAMARRLWAQSQAEERAGLVSDSAIKQNARFISSIINKGEEFEPLLTHPVATELLTHMLGEHFNLSTGFAKILMPGAKAETLHTDQWWSAPPQKRVLSLPPSQPPVRSGSITRELAYTTEMHAGSEVSAGGVMYIPPCNANQAVFLLSDFTATNGSTLLVPGSHICGRHPTKAEAENGGAKAGAVPLVAPAGSLICFDSRCWHMSGSFPAAAAAAGSGGKTSGGDSVLTQPQPAADGWVDDTTNLPLRLGVFMNYVAPMVRQNENYAITIDPAVRQRLPPCVSRSTMGHARIKPCIYSWTSQSCMVSK